MKEENTLRHSLGPKMERAGPEQCPTILPQDHNPVMYANVTMTLQFRLNRFLTVFLSGRHLGIGPLRSGTDIQFLPVEDVKGR